MPPEGVPPDGVPPDEATAFVSTPESEAAIDIGRIVSASKAAGGAVPVSWAEGMLPPPPCKVGCVTPPDAGATDGAGGVIPTEVGAGVTR